VLLLLQYRRIKKAKNPEKLTSSEKSSGDKDTDQFDFGTTLEELDTFKGGSCPANTAKNTEWALQAIESWRAARNIKYSSDQCPANLLESSPSMQLAV